MVIVWASGASENHVRGKTVLTVKNGNPYDALKMKRNQYVELYASTKRCRPVSGSYDDLHAEVLDYLQAEGLGDLQAEGVR